MNLQTKVGALTIGAMLGVAGIALPAAAHSSTSSSEVTTPVPGGGTTQIQLAGIGVLSVTIDAAGLITDAQLAAASGVTAGVPVVTPDGVHLAVTLADGTQQTVTVSGELEDGVPTVEAEVAPPSDDDESESDDGQDAVAPPAPAPVGHGDPEGETDDH